MTLPTFTTPEPIQVTIKLAVGVATIVASERGDTVVTVAPHNPDLASDVQSARRVTVDYTGNTLRISQAFPWHFKFSTRKLPGMVSITVELPSGSRVHGEATMGAFRSRGLLGKCTFSASYGGIQLDEINDDLRVKSSHGSILVQRAHANVNARTSAGNIVVGEVVRGTVDVATAVGEVEVGVRPGTAAHLNLRTRLGRIRNALSPGTANETAPGNPPAPADAVTIHARTNLDDILIRPS
jgi:hypothetical protein